MKTILIHSLVFSPDCVSTAYLYNDIALKFKESGFNVVVLTTTPHYNFSEKGVALQPLKKKLLGLYYVSYYNGIKVYHVKQKKYSNSLLRMIGFIYWHIMSFLIALSIKKIDLIISPSPPLTIAFVNILISKIKKSKTIYNVQEIYPDLLIESGKLKSKFIINQLKRLEKYIYKKTDLIITIDEVFYQAIIDRINDSSKLKIIPNFVDTDLYKPTDYKTSNLDCDIFPDNESLKVMYAGNIGLAQDWDLLIEIAKNLKEEKVIFYIVGEGVMKQNLQKSIIENNLNNIQLIPYQSRELMPALLSYADLHFIFMEKKTEMYGFPSKVYTIMACSKPLLVSSGDNTPIIKFLSNKHSSYCFSNQNKNEKIASIVTFLKNIKREELLKTGETGRTIIENEYSKELVVNKFIEITTNLD